MKFVKTKDKLPSYVNNFCKYSNDVKGIPIRFKSKYTNNDYKYAIGIYNPELGYWQHDYDLGNTKYSVFTNIDELVLVQV